MHCEIEGCADDAAVELHIPWKENEVVCTGHARVKGQADGVVVEPLDNAADALPDGASR